MLVAAGACGVLLAALLGVQIYLVVSGRAQAKDTRAAVGRLSVQLRAIVAGQAKLDDTLRQPANAEVLQRSVLLNALVERKSVSWTRIFADLEGVMPHNVRLIQVRLPQINSQNEVLLDMVVGARAPEPVIDFLKRLQGSPQFGPATVYSSQPPSQNEPLYRYRVSVNYGQRL